MNLGVKFYLNEAKPKGSQYTIYIRLTYNRQKVELTSGYHVEKAKWDEVVQKVKGNSHINTQLNEFYNRAQKIKDDLLQTRQEITIRDIKDFLTGKEKASFTLIEWYKKYIARIKRDPNIQHTSVLKYQQTLSYLTDFLTSIKKTDLSVKNIKYQFLKEFDLYLKNQKAKSTKKLLEANTINKHHSRLRTILIDAIKHDQLDKNPYSDFKLKYEPSNRTFLTLEDLKKIKDCDLSENYSLERVRDVFLFSCYTGLRFEDAQKLTWTNIKKSDSGKIYLQLDQTKTRKQVSPPLISNAIEIFERYKVENEVSKRLLPQISNQKANAYLKVIATLAGIDQSQPLTHHVARHTCATILLSNGEAIEMVQSWLGHNNSKTTEIYAKIVRAAKENAATKLENLL